jgi:hypothetical protein
MVIVVVQYLVYRRNKKVIKLLGARKFIDLPAGTLYSEYWLNNTQECEKMIESFRENPHQFLDFKSLLIYESNSCSAMLEGHTENEEPWFTDINVVGDANPNQTLRVVFDLKHIPEKFEVRGENYDDRTIWTKRGLMKLIKEVKKNDYRDHKWAHEILEERFKSGNRIIDVEIESNI